MAAADPGSALSALSFSSLLLLAAAALAAAVTTGLVTRLLRRRAILDHPNERSSHAVPTPRGGGWGILAVLVPGWLLLGVSPLVLAGLVGLAAVSWLDDRRGLPPWPRLAAQGLAVALGLAALGDQARLFPGWLPGWLDHGLAALAWLWFINLFNFMDGIDGIAGSEAASVAGGVALVAGGGVTFLVAGGGVTFLVAGGGVTPGLGVGRPELVAPALVLAGAALGFLVWNWQPARVFLGDVGSVPLGFGLGWLLLAAATAGLGAAALLLPLVFVADASFTLGRRALAGRRIWQPHREHLYQRAVQGGWSHARVVRAMLVANAALIGLALAVPTLGSAAALAAGAAVVVALLLRLAAVGLKPSP